MMWSSDVTIGERCQIHESVQFFGKVIIGDDVTIHPLSLIGSQPLSADFIQDPYPHWKPRVSGRPVIIEDGVVILCRSTVQSGSHLKKGCLLGNYSMIGHDTVIGEGTCIHAGVHTAGHVNIGRLCVVEPECFIGRRVNMIKRIHIGAGSIVLNDLTRKGLYYGRPAKWVRR